jgi:hypothetical protein
MPDSTSTGPISVEVRLSQFLIERKISVEEVNELLNREESDQAILQDDKISLSAKDALYILYGELDDDFADLSEKFPDFKDKFASDLTELALQSDLTESIAQAESQMNNQDNPLATKLKKAFAEFQEANLTAQPSSKDPKLITAIPKNLEEMILSTHVVNDAVKSAEENIGKKVNYETRQKIQDLLIPALTTLDSGYLESVQGILIKKLTAKLTKDKVFSKKPEAIKEIVRQYEYDILRIEKKKSDEFVKKGINDSIQAHRLSDSQIAERLSEFLTKTPDQHGQFHQGVTTAQSKGLKDDDLRMIRQRNPKDFDKIMFPPQERIQVQEQLAKHREEVSQLTKQGDAAKDSKSFAIDILLATIKMFTDKFKLKVTERSFRKFFVKLQPVLAELDPQYLASHKDEIAKSMLADLRGEKNVKVRGDRAAFTATGLDKVAAQIARDHQVANDKFVEQQAKEGVLVINENLASHQVTNSRLGDRVAEYLATDNVHEAATRLGIFSKEELKLADNVRKATDRLRGRTTSAVPKEYSEKSLAIVAKATEDHEEVAKVFGSGLTDQHLVKLRMINPEKFDKAIFRGEDFTKSGQKETLYEDILRGAPEITFKGTMLRHVNSGPVIVNPDPKDPRLGKIIAKQAAKKTTSSPGH